MKPFEELTDDQKGIASSQEHERVLELSGRMYEIGKTPSWLSPQQKQAFIALANQCRDEGVGQTMFLARLHAHTTLGAVVENEALERAEATIYLEPGEESPQPVPEPSVTP